MIMTAHVIMPELQMDCDVETQEGCDPATLDREILTGLLREELGYDGVVITDALNMAGVREKYGDERIPVLALKAGVDMPMMVDTTTDTVSLEMAYEVVLNAVRSGEIAEARVDESVRRCSTQAQARALPRPVRQRAKGAGETGQARAPGGSRARRRPQRHAGEERRWSSPAGTGDGGKGARYRVPLRVEHARRRAGHAPRRRA